MDHPFTAFATTAAHLVTAATHPAIRPFADALRGAGLFLINDERQILALVKMARSNSRDRFLAQANLTGSAVGGETLWRRFRGVIATEGDDRAHN